ncbi:MAG TPA: hypothetical protein VGP61_11395 [Gemmatimonadales bacterium]|nr:hypothetical protein [Gemmatimonadales bacterium]
MRSLLFVPAALTLLAAAPSGGGAQQKLARRIAIAADASIRILNLAGTTRVTGWDRDSIAVSGFAPAGVNFFMGGAGRMAKLGLEPDETAKPAARGALEVRVPQRARVWIKSAEGSIEVTGVSGELDLSSVGGSIRVSGTLRLITAESIEGDIELVGASALVRAKTGGGKLVLRHPGGDLTASTVSGALTMSEAQPTSAVLETVSGPVNYAGSIAPHGVLNIQTHSGDVELLLPAEIGAEFDLQSLGGMVGVELPAKMGKPRKGKSLFFANAGGGAQIVVRSFKGQIRVVGQ